MAQRLIGRSLSSIEDLDDELEFPDTYQPSPSEAAYARNLREWQDDIPERSVLTEDEAIEPLVHAINSLEDTASAKTSCSSCSSSSRVMYVSEFKHGQHISMPGKKGKHFNKTFGKQIHFYKHHAIVKQVRPKSRFEVELDLIHFDKEDGKLNIYQATKQYNLKTDEIYITKYTFMRYTPDEIVKRAEQVAQNPNKDKFKSYNPLTSNCEHFATWCVNGKDECFQTNILTDIFDSGCRIGGTILNQVVKAIGISADEVVELLTNPKDYSTWVVGGVSVVYLIYSIVKTIVYVYRYFKNNMCKQCLKEKLIGIWVRFGTFATMSALSFVILKFVLPLLTGGWGVVLVVIMCSVSIIVQEVGNVIANIFKSPITFPEKRMKTILDAKVGDVLSYSYYALKHHAIIVEVKQVWSSKKGDIRCIHYGLPSFFGRRKIIEETVSVDLDKSQYSVVDFGATPCFRPENVVLRAKARVGERKWSLDNQSDHFCLWAKVYHLSGRSRVAAEDLQRGIGHATSSSTTRSTTHVEDRHVHLMEEIQLGDVVRYIEYRKGIVVAIEPLSGKSGRKFQITLIIGTYDVLPFPMWLGSTMWLGVQRSYTVDLDQDTLKLSIYHPVQCRPMQERVDRAKAMKNKTGKSWTRESFIFDCILLDSVR